MASLYLLINLATIAAPLAFSFHPKLQFYKNWKAFFPANFIVAFVFIVWDIIFTSKGVWGFNERYLLGIYISHLPLEEVLFFICIPFACTFTFHCLMIFWKINWHDKTEKIFCALAAIILLILGIINYDKLYTSITFISTAFLLVLLKFVFKINWLGKFISIYPIILIPFFIVNGILTGTGLDAPVVWYNNNENLGIRMLTIPVEDTVYGFELLVLNLFFYHLFLKKNTVAKTN